MEYVLHKRTCLCVPLFAKSNSCYSKLAENLLNKSLHVLMHCLLINICRNKNKSFKVFKLFQISIKNYWQSTAPFLRGLNDFLYILGQKLLFLRS